jgi:uncharacterized LabA/DUF88 family protein
MTNTHGPLLNNLVHIFVDDQNLWIAAGAESTSARFRLDFGELLNYVSKDEANQVRAVRTAMIAGTVPPEDSFWEIARNQGFAVKLGYRGFGGKSKQDDHHVTADMVETVCTEPGPSTVILVAGDGDYGPCLDKALARGWRVEVFFVRTGLSPEIERRAHRYVKIHPADIEVIPGKRKRPKKGG